MCISSSSSVRVGARTTERTIPVLFGFASSLSHWNTVDPIRGFWAASVAAAPSAADKTTIVARVKARIGFLTCVLWRTTVVVAAVGRLEDLRDVLRALVGHTQLLERVFRAPFPFL